MRTVRAEPSKQLVRQVECASRAGILRDGGHDEPRDAEAARLWTGRVGARCRTAAIGGHDGTLSAGSCQKGSGPAASRDTDPYRSMRDLILRFARRLRFPWLFLLTAVLFAIDLVVPDLIPFADEILLGLLTLLFGFWRQRRQERIEARATPDAPRAGGD